MSLLADLDDSREAARPVFSMRAREVADQPTEFKDAVIQGRHKLIVTSSGERAELYDLVDDPAETRNRAATDTASVARLRALLEELSGSLQTWERQFVPVELDDDRRARIEELGYGGE